MNNKFNTEKVNLTLMTEQKDLTINISALENSIFHPITNQEEMPLGSKSFAHREIPLSLIFETIPNGIAILDQQGRIIAANVAAEKILRLTRSHLTNLVYNYPTWNVSSVDHQPFPKEKLPFSQVMQTGESVYGVEYGIQHDDGTEIILSINAAPLKNTEGEIISVITSFSDITEHKYAEGKLRESEQRYHSVIETAAEGIVLQQADGDILACNGSAERILGLSAEQMMGRTSVDPRWYALHEDGTPFQGKLHPGIVTLRTGKPQTNIIMGIHKPNGTLTWISANTRALFSPGETKPYGVVASFFDITERKETQEKLLVSDAALQQMPNAIILTDLEGKIQRWIGKAEPIFGYTESEMMGKDLSLLYQDNRQGEILNSIQEKGFFEGELIGLKKDGTTLPIETTVKAVYDQKGKAIFLISIHQDISDRKQAELERIQLLQEQAARVEAELVQRRSSFLAQVSELLTSSLDYEKTLKRVAKLAVPFLADWCMVDLVNSNQSLSRLAVAHSNPNKVQLGWDLHQRYPIDRNANFGVAKVLKTRRTEYCSEISDSLLRQASRNEEHLTLLRQLNLKSYIIAPLMARGHILGTITLMMAESDRH
ncbi:MAG: PAS domain S-box protein, partial [Halothece sp.]